MSKVIDWLVVKSSNQLFNIMKWFEPKEIGVHEEPNEQHDRECDERNGKTLFLDCFNFHDFSVCKLSDLLIFRNSPRYTNWVQRGNNYSIYSLFLQNPADRRCQLANNCSGPEARYTFCF